MFWHPIILTQQMSPVGWLHYRSSLTGGRDALPQRVLARTVRNPSNVLNVTKSLLVLEIWMFICELTVVRNPSNVLNATKSLQVLEIWMLMFEFTVVRNPSNVLNATKSLQLLEIWMFICEHTVVRNTSNVLNVTGVLVIQAICNVT